MKFKAIRKLRGVLRLLQSDPISNIEHQRKTSELICHEQANEQQQHIERV